MTRFKTAFVCIIVFSIIVCAAMYVIGRTMVAPVGGEQRTYSAVFNDASGLYTGSSVRLAGVAVGKVDSVSVDGTLAKVEFTVQSEHAPDDNSQFAIRYQNLVGQRYLEMIRVDGARGRQNSADVIQTDRTISAFDVTEVFSNVVPLIGDLDPGDLNKFAENLGLVLQGDGAGMAPVLESVAKIAGFAKNRDQVMVLMVENLNRLAKQIGGRSERVAQLVSNLNAAIMRLTTQMGAVQESLDYADGVLPQFVDILETLFGAFDNNAPALLAMANRVVPATPQILAAVAAIPGLLEKLNKALPAVPSEPKDLVCANGRINLADTVQVLIGGKDVIVCN
ncbi:Mce family protein [Gordonia effusa NBRC 100432]|uniref:Mce family protein n=1 Tax=Gordonia effusa NBRC 100432 TaxID=1077974 RepID=H0QWP3_9ACTN|nr:MlaD family protein [Gordonia effusa]GAB17244.1 Mce family protein [Gordonia effusa NBRC 100432]